MSSSTMPHHAPANGVAGFQTRTEAVELRTDEGLRDALRSVQRSGSWETPAGQQLPAEIRRRAVRNAAPTDPVLCCYPEQKPLELCKPLGMLSARMPNSWAR